MTDLNPRIKIIDDLTPEDCAMIQALYSRSPASVETHLDNVAKKGSGSFLEHYYVGYGHSSIGDCGTTTIFIEGVTMLTAKAVQDWALYSGQESSTRYMDFSTAVFSNPLGTSDGEAIQERWREFYLRIREPVIAHLRQRYPVNEGEDTNIYERAIAARAFDTTRCFLPAGATTNLSWHTNLRQAADHLRWMACHPDPFIAGLGERIMGDLRAKYTSSFGHKVRDGEIEYRTEAMRDHFLLPDDIDDEVHVEANFSQSEIKDIRLVKERPRGVEVPRFMAELGHIRSEFPLDFGSYRDLQRHRNGIVRMPLLTTELGFNDWYLGELPDDLRAKAEALIDEQARAIDNLECDPVVAQNYMGMGFQVQCRVTQGLPAFVYRMELRSSKTVHPSLRRVVIQEIAAFRKMFPDVTLYVDEDPDSWTVRRGKQTIVEKQ